MLGCLIAALTYFPLFKALPHNVNPDLEAYAVKTPVSVAASDCSMHIFPTPKTVFTLCDKAKDFLTKNGLTFQELPAVGGEAVVTKIGDVELKGFKEDDYKAALKTTGYPDKFDKTKMNWGMTILILVIYVTMVYGPIAAWLVELFPARIRYTSMSLPYHIGNGWFGGFLPTISFAMVAASGDIYYGLWYPIVIAVMTAIIGLIFMPETKDREIHHEATTA